MNTLNDTTLDTNPIAALLNGENEVVRVYDTVEEAFDAAQGTDRVVAHQEWLEAQSMGALAEIYNKNTRSIQIKRFSTKEVAVQRVLKLFGEIQVDDAMAAVEAAPEAVQESAPELTDDQQAMLAQSAAADRVAAARADAYNADAAAEVTEIAAAAKKAPTPVSATKANVISDVAVAINQAVPGMLANAKAIEVSVKLGKGQTVYVVPSTKDTSCRVYVMGTARTTLAPIIASFLGQEATESKGASTFKVGTHSDVINLIADLITAC